MNRDNHATDDQDLHWSGVVTMLSSQLHSRAPSAIDKQRTEENIIDDQKAQKLNDDERIDTILSSSVVNITETENNDNNDNNDASAVSKKKYA